MKVNHLRIVMLLFISFVGTTGICSPAISKAQETEKRLLAGSPELAGEIVGRVIRVIKDLVSERGKRVPPEILQKAAGIVIIPNLVKAGFVPGGRHGAGLLMVSENDEWSPPIFLSITGGDIGTEIEIPSADLVLFFTSRDTVDRLKEGGSLVLGIDASIQAGPTGPIDGSPEKETEIFVYSRSEEPEAISLTGSTLAFDRDTTLSFYEEGIEDTARAYYGKEQRLTQDLLSIDERGRIDIPEAAEDLQELLKKASDRSAE